MSITSKQQTDIQVNENVPLDNCTSTATLAEERNSQTRSGRDEPEPAPVQSSSYKLKLIFAALLIWPLIPTIILLLSWEITWKIITVICIHVFFGVDWTEGTQDEEIFIRYRRRDYPGVTPEASPELSENEVEKRVEEDADQKRQTEHYDEFGTVSGAIVQKEEFDDDEQFSQSEEPEISEDSISLNAEEVNYWILR